MDVGQYLSLFIDESKEHLQSLSDCLLELETNPEKLSLVNQAFRSAHTLKGMAATMGFSDLASLTHEMENVLDPIRHLKISLNQAVFEALFQSLDALEGMVADIVQGGDGKTDVGPIVALLRSIVNHQPIYAHHQANGPSELDEYQCNVIKHSIQSGHKAVCLEIKLHDGCLLKTARTYMVFETLYRNGEVIKSTPSVTELEDEKSNFSSFSVYYISNVDPSILETEIMSVSEIYSVKIKVLDDESLAKMKDGKKADLPLQVTDASALRPNNIQQRVTSVGASRTIRVDTDRIDRLLNLFSELLIDQGRLQQIASNSNLPPLVEVVEHMVRVNSELQNTVLKLRMVPVDTVFSRFPRTIRDLAKSLNKKVDLKITGAETELDRTVIDEIGDPLVHLLRNAIDHGIESVDKRLAAGKSEIGTVSLRAYHGGNHVFIEVEEDGAGINKEKVLYKAIHSGFISKDQSVRMSDDEVYQLLFESAFSTADKISDISGRGVGLDVVKSKIQSLGGQVSVESSLGRGTKFQVQLPLTLSIISTMMIELGNECFAIPLSSILETSTIKAIDTFQLESNLMMKYRGSMIPVISLSKLLGVEGFSEDDEETSEIIIIKKGEKRAALLIDKFIGQKEIVLKPLGEYLSGLHMISGATILGDGRVGLVIDTNKLIK